MKDAFRLAIERPEDRRAHNASLFFAYLFCEYLTNHGLVSRPGALPQLEPLVSQSRVESATIIRARNSLKQTFLLQPIDQTRDATSAKKHPLRQLRHHQPPLWSVFESEQDVIDIQSRQPSQREFPVNLPSQHRMPNHKRNPRALMIRRELFFHCMTFYA